MMAGIIRAAGMLVYRHNAGRIEYLLLQASYPPYHWSPPKDVPNYRGVLYGDVPSDVRKTCTSFYFPHNPFVRGHVDPDEDEWSAALRETSEEAGITADNLDIHMDFVEVMKYVVKKNDRYRGEINKQKTVKYWLAELKNNKEIKLSDEHQNFNWFPAGEASMLAQYKEMQDLIRKAEEYLVNKK